MNGNSDKFNSPTISRNYLRQKRDRTAWNGNAGKCQKVALDIERISWRSTSTGERGWDIWGSPGFKEEGLDLKGFRNGIFIDRGLDWRSYHTADKSSKPNAVPPSYGPRRIHPHTCRWMATKYPTIQMGFGNGLTN